MGSSGLGAKLRAFAKKLSRPPDGYMALVRKADAARDRREFAAAAEAYEAALAIRPGEAPIWVQLGNMAKDSGDFARAQFAYKRALNLRPNDADIHLQLGHLHKLAGDRDEALASYVMANRLDPTNASATTEIEAMKAAIKASAISPAPERPVRSPRKRVIRKASFNARVLDARNSLQELLRPGARIGSTALGRLDAARPVMAETIAALETILQSELGATGAPQAGQGTMPSIVFDVSDLIQYFRHHRLPTGIQRVQIEAISIALLRAPNAEAVKVCCFTEEDDYWREVPPHVFLELCELSLIGGDWTAPEWREQMGDLDELLHSSADFRFAEGAFLVNIGTSWWLQNYFLNVREAKHRSKIRYVAFVHDMIPIMAPEYCVEGLVKDFVGWAQAVYRHADFYFVNSEATRADLLKVAAGLGYEVAPERIRTIRLDADYRKPDVSLPTTLDSLRQHRLTPGNYVLFVSTIEARKNHASMFDAWLKLCKDHGDDAIPKLVCVGSRGWLNESVFAKLTASERLREKVVMLSNVKDEELSSLYRDCLFSVYPSFYEGWGLPVTEALCYGKPVVASRSSSLPEAGGEFADYFAVGDATSLLDALTKLIFDVGYREARAARICAEFKPRRWQDIVDDIQGAIAIWDASGGALAGAAPLVELGRYYPFSRNTQIGIHTGLRSGEVFRSGSGWWGASEWGCWLKPGPAEILFSVPDGAIEYRLYVGLRSPETKDAPFDLTVLPGNKIRGMLKAGQTKWVVVEFEPRHPDQEIRVVLEGYVRHQDKPRADLDPIEVSIAVIGLYVCAASDMTSRGRFAEAVSLDDIAGLTRVQTTTH